VTDTVRPEIARRYPGAEILLHPMSLTSGAHMVPDLGVASCGGIRRDAIGNVIPAKAGIQDMSWLQRRWTPAFAGVTISYGFISV